MNRSLKVKGMSPLSGFVLPVPKRRRGGVGERGRKAI
jgi:hypothetical protein